MGNPNPNKSTRFSSTRQPSKERRPHGKLKRTLILEAIKEKSLLDLPKDASIDDAEKAYFGFLAEAAFNPTSDTAIVSNTALNVLSKKGWPDAKATVQEVQFEHDKDATPIQKCNDILEAISRGELPPDVGQGLIATIVSMAKLEEDKSDDSPEININIVDAIAHKMNQDAD